MRVTCRRLSSLRQHSRPARVEKTGTPLSLRSPLAMAAADWTVCGTGVGHLCVVLATIATWDACSSVGSKVRLTRARRRRAGRDKPCPLYLQGRHRARALIDPCILIYRLIADWVVCGTMPA
jgi:hypothetical protein